MLKKENRIRKNKEFDRVFKNGQTFYGKELGVKAVKNDMGVSRFGILISTKVSKKAVVRNLFRRRLRSIIEKDLADLKEGYDVVIIVFSQILDKNFLEVALILRTGLKKLRLYK